MNYKNIYDLIIENAKTQKRTKISKLDSEYVYYEEHHIIPKCVGGNNENENKILLTPREHYICHKLLPHIYKNRGLSLAFQRMLYDKINRNVSSRDYAYLKYLLSITPISDETRKKISETKKGKPATHLKGIKKSEEHKKKLSEANIGFKVSTETKEKIRISKTGVKFSDEHKQHIKDSKVDVKFSDEHKQHIKDSKTGEKNPNFGKKRSLETIEKIKNSCKGKKHSYKKRTKIIK